MALLVVMEETIRVVVAEGGVACLLQQEEEETAESVETLKLPARVAVVVAVAVLPTRMEARGPAAAAAAAARRRRCGFQAQRPWALARQPRHHTAAVVAVAPA